LEEKSGQVALVRRIRAMQYILLIYENEAAAKARKPEESQKVFR
jgi:hypothetical protein